MNKFRNLHLIISVVIVLPVAFVYGSGNNTLFSLFFDFSPYSTDMHSIFRAMMFLYLGMAGLWLLGIFNPWYWEAATISNFLFMFALALGRLLSFTLDGNPSLILIIGFWGEALLALLAWLNFQKNKPN